MTEQFIRVTMRNATAGGGYFESLLITGHLAKVEPESPALREIIRPVIPDEPDTETEVGYSRNALEPLTIVYQSRKIVLPYLPYRMFRYINDLHRTEEQTEFEFSEISAVLTGKEFGKSKNAIELLARRISVSLENICAPIHLNCNREILYVLRHS